MRDLHLNLHKKWFDAILEGRKKEEYRMITPYWCNRLLLFNGETKSADWWLTRYNSDFDIEVRLFGDIVSETVMFQDFHNVIFSNGYAKDRNQFKIELKSIKTGRGQDYWGAIPGKLYFVLKLGKIIKE